MMNEELNLPNFPFRIEEKSGTKFIWDEFRKKEIVLTPEEWVRQNFLRFLNENLGYPKSLIKVEFEIKYNKLKKRPDIVAFDRDGKSLLVVECKAPSVKITNEVFKQVATYNQTLKAKYLVVTNGLDHFCFEQNLNSGTFKFLEKIPDYNQ